MAADANEALIGATTALAKQATRYDSLKLPDVLARKMLLLKLSAAVPAPAPNDPKELAELARIGTSLEADYGKGKYCPKTGKHAGECLDITAIEQIMANSTDPDELKDLWVGWRTISPPMRDRYSRWVELGNKGAREMGFKDLGAMWRAGYDMTPEQFSQEVERLWQQVKPLYDSLHAYVRAKLVEKYGPTAVDANGMIRADLLGNPWAQEWGNIFTAGRAAATEATVRRNRSAEGEERRSHRDGEVRRRLLHLDGFRAAAQNVLGAFAVREAARS